MNPELTQYAIPLAAVLATLGYGLGNETVKNTASKAYTWISSYFGSKNNPDDEFTDPLPYYSVHELLEELIKRSEEESDSEGLMLLGAYGKHVYDLRLTPPPVPTPKKKTSKASVKEGT